MDYAKENDPFLFFQIHVHIHEKRCALLGLCWEAGVQASPENTEEVCRFSVTPSPCTLFTVTLGAKRKKGGKELLFLNLEASASQTVLSRSLWIEKLSVHFIKANLLQYDYGFEGIIPGFVSSQK